MDYSQLSIPTSAQFFEITHSLNKDFVEKIFVKLKKLIGTNQLLGEVVRKKAQVDKKPYVFSFAGFSTANPPTFLRESNLVETRYGFLLIIEAGNYLGLFKKGASGIEAELGTKTKPIARTELTQAYGDGATYKKLSLRRLTISQHELQGSSYEAQNIENALPTLSLSRSVPRFLRLNNDTVGSVSITPSTGRIHVGGEKQGIKGAARLTYQVGTEVNKPARESFLSSFAIPIAKVDLPVGIPPVGIQFDLTTLLEEGHYKATITKNNGTELDITSKLAERLDRVFHVLPDGQNWKFVNFGSPRKIGTLEWRGERLSVALNTKNVIRLEKDAEPAVKFDRWTQHESSFSVCFGDASYFYTSGQLFRTSNLSSEIRIVASVLRVIPELNTVTSEKGDWNNGVRTSYAQVDTFFRPQTTFSVLEDNIADAQDHVWGGPHF